jgi:hypothetical protein
MWGVGRKTRCGLSSHHCFGSMGGPCTALTQSRVRGRDIAGSLTSTLFFQRQHDACPCKLQPSHSATSCSTLIWLASFAPVLHHIGRIPEADWGCTIGSLAQRHALRTRRISFCASASTIFAKDNITTWTYRTGRCGRCGPFFTASQRIQGA